MCYFEQHRTNHSQLLDIDVRRRTLEPILVTVLDASQVSQRHPLAQYQCRSLESVSLSLCGAAARTEKRHWKEPRVTQRLSITCIVLFVLDQLIESLPALLRDLVELLPMDNWAR